MLLPRRPDEPEDIVDTFSGAPKAARSPGAQAKASR
jgi:hypothetical protein